MSDLRLITLQEEQFIHHLEEAAKKAVLLARKEWESEKLSRGEDPQLLSKHQAAKLFGVSVQTIDLLRKDGEIKIYRIRGSIRFSKKELFEYAERWAI